MEKGAGPHVGNNEDFARVARRQMRRWGLVAAAAILLTAALGLAIESRNNRAHETRFAQIITDLKRDNAMRHAHELHNPQIQQARQRIAPLYEDRAPPPIIVQVW